MRIMWTVKAIGKPLPKLLQMYFLRTQKKTKEKKKTYVLCTHSRRLVRPSNANSQYMFFFFFVCLFFMERKKKTITKTCLYNFDPLKPHFYIVKLGFTGVYIIFLISAQKHRLWVLVRTALPRRF